MEVLLRAHHLGMRLSLTTPLRAISHPEPPLRRLTCTSLCFILWFTGWELAAFCLSLTQIYGFRIKLNTVEINNMTFQCQFEEMTQSNQGKDWFITVQNGSDSPHPKTFPQSCQLRRHNNSINKTKPAKTHGLFLQWYHGCRWKSPFLYLLLLSIIWMIRDMKHQVHLSGGTTVHTHQRERKSLLICGPKKHYDVDPTALENGLLTLSRHRVEWIFWCFKFLPINIPEKRCSFDVTLTFRCPQPLTLFWEVGHQLQEKENVEQFLKREWVSWISPRTGKTAQRRLPTESLFLAFHPSSNFQLPFCIGDLNSSVSTASWIPRASPYS